MSVTVANSSFQNYTHWEDHTRQTTDTPGFKPFTKKYFKSHKDVTKFKMCKKFLAVITLNGNGPKMFLKLNYQAMLP